MSWMGLRSCLEQSQCVVHRIQIQFPVKFIGHTLSVSHHHQRWELNLPSSSPLGGLWYTDKSIPMDIDREIITKRLIGAEAPAPATTTTTVRERNRKADDSGNQSPIKMIRRQVEYLSNHNQHQRQLFFYQCWLVGKQWEELDILFI